MTTPRPKVRIVERQFCGTVQYVIQQRHWLCRWMWVDAWLNAWEGASCQDSFSTLEEARRKLCYFDGTKPEEVVVVVSPR